MSTKNQMLIKLVRFCRFEWKFQELLFELRTGLPVIFIEICGFNEIKSLSLTPHVFTYTVDKKRSFWFKTLKIKWHFLCSNMKKGNNKKERKPMCGLYSPGCEFPLLIFQSLHFHSCLSLKKSDCEWFNLIAL